MLEEIYRRSNDASKYVSKHTFYPFLVKQQYIQEKYWTAQFP